MANKEVGEPICAGNGIAEVGCQCSSLLPPPSPGLKRAWYPLLAGCTVPKEI